ncbi:MAG: glycosyltransferase family 4 protein [Actinobacteria bacterium]|nr:MAG: glycosyltransferase family 4 protein [Actinomycetota bacterium]
MPQSLPADVLIVSLGSTAGLRAADEALAASLQRAGAHVEVVSATAPRPAPTLMLTDLAWARAVRDAARAALARRVSPPRAMIYSSTTAACFWPMPGAIRFDATAAGNRPGRHGLWQRPLERLRLRQAPLLLPWSEGALAESPVASQQGGRSLVLPVAVERSCARDQDGPDGGARDIAAITYAANPAKKGLDRVLAAWRRARAECPAAAGGELVVAGATSRLLQRAGIDVGEAGVRVVGALEASEYRALLRRARAFVCAPRREDYGLAQLEALADGCALVTTAAPGPYAALPLARELDPRLVGDDLARGIRTALEDPLPGYARRAEELLAPFSPASVDRLVAEALLPRLLGGPLAA